MKVIALFLEVFPTSEFGEIPNFVSRTSVEGVSVCHLSYLFHGSASAVTDTASASRCCISIGVLFIVLQSAVCRREAKHARRQCQSLKPQTPRTEPAHPQKQSPRGQARALVGGRCEGHTPSHDMDRG